ncbi:hypothetical protein AGABI2DRAFT_122744 [Agaricus bisporus var. bisporus H97]|uniref:hypothetical protein n=1 Tax=Agaricus bisporus var. bisporus (strain H97 / ATCC MYA-4626 / FGSC 10389) TaxID=936046 RepID=UPI00029F6314|nr:hypothetical protein AGABI2DRAFT_122744 [Agaricus bisporus var. bisporus H97]EKV42523.1 hypothetical protein AGABI2DRAFT_122744 [Agaricus bisporus var. bisporus H97]
MSDLSALTPIPESELSVSVAGSPRQTLNLAPPELVSAGQPMAGESSTHPVTSKNKKKKHKKAQDTFSSALASAIDGQQAAATPKPRKPRRSRRSRQTKPVPEPVPVLGRL